MRNDELSRLEHQIRRAEKLAVAAREFVRMLKNIEPDAESVPVSETLKGLSDEGWVALSVVAGLKTPPSPATRALTISVCVLAERLMAGGDRPDGGSDE